MEYDFRSSPNNKSLDKFGLIQSRAMISQSFDDFLYAALSGFQVALC